MKLIQIPYEKSSMTNFHIQRSIFREITILKTSKLLKFEKDFCCDLHDITFVCTYSNIWLEISGILGPDFSRIFRIRFFSWIFFLRDLRGRGSNSRPFCSLWSQKFLHQSFCYLEEAGVHEKGKKPTFWREITLLEKNIFNKNCSEMNKFFWENYFSGIF